MTAQAGEAMIEIRRPEGPPVALVLDSPHSGTVYPDDFRAIEPPGRYRRSEDMYVDELFAAGPSLGIPLLAARFARAYCDVNRARDDLDPSVSERHGLVGRTPCDLARGKGDDERCHVREVVQRVRDQREAARQDAADDLRDGEQPVRPDGNGHPAIA